jgi:hypothetical protein
MFDRCFARKYRLHLQYTKESIKNKACILIPYCVAYNSTLKMETVRPMRENSVGIPHLDTAPGMIRLLFTALRVPTPVYSSHLVLLLYRLFRLLSRCPMSKHLLMMRRDWTLAFLVTSL